MRKLVLLLTATIDVGETILVARKNPADRLKDYREALRQWMAASSIETIVFAENSGFPDETFRGVCELPARVRYLSYREPSFPKEYGKGYGEISIIRNALEHYPDLDSETMILKVTGRYYLNNHESIVKLARESDFDIICDLQHNLTFADTRAFAASVRFLRDYLCPLQKCANDAAGTFMEHLTAKATLLAMNEGLTWCLPTEAFDIVGVSGTRDLPYGRDLKRRLFRSVRHQLKRYVFGC